MGKVHPSQTWQYSWKAPKPVHANPCLVKGCTDEAELKKAFTQQGEVKTIFVPEGQGFALVHFADDHSAEKAIKALNGKQIAGQSVEVKDGKACDKDLMAWRNSLTPTTSSVTAGA